MNVYYISDVDGQLKSEDTFAALLFDEASADAVAPLLNAHNIMQLLTTSSEKKASQLLSVSQSNKDSIMNVIFYSSKLISYCFTFFNIYSNFTRAVLNFILQAGSNSNDNLIDAILSLIHTMNMYTYSIIRDSTKKTEYLSQRLQNRILPESVCLSGVHTLQNNASSPVITKDVAFLLKPGTLVILLLEDPKHVQGFLEVCQSFHSIIFITALQSRGLLLNAGNVHHVLIMFIVKLLIYQAVWTEYQIC